MAAVATQREPRERPILFSGPMVRALLEGRKTQTRRVISGAVTCGETPYWPGMKHGGDFVRATHCPYGVPGDRLWVRESLTFIRTVPDPALGERHVANYVADDARCERLDTWPWQRDTLPSIHMPYGLCRIRLEITDVRVDRLQAITPYDVQREGVEVARCDCEVCQRSTTICPADGSAYLEAFAELWDGINGKRAPFDDDPWVWVVSFRRLEDPRRG